MLDFEQGWVRPYFKRQVVKLYFNQQVQNLHIFRMFYSSREIIHLQHQHSKVVHIATVID